METVFWAVFAGLLTGSFLNVAVSRLPVMMERAWTKFAKEHLGLPQDEEAEAFGLCRPASHCPHCRTPIAWHDNIPLLGFVRLRGRCAVCSTRIALRYPVLEALTAACFGVVAWRYGAAAETLYGCLLAAFLLAGAFIDAETQYLPDQTTLPLLWLGFLFNFSDGLVTLQEAVAGAAAGYACLWLLNAAHKYLRGADGMGGGDFKLFAALGAWLGVFALPLLAFIAALIGLAAALLMRAGKGQALPFGPSLAAAGGLLFIGYRDIMPVFYRFLSGG